MEAAEVTDPLLGSLFEPEIVDGTSDYKDLVSVKPPQPLAFLPLHVLFPLPGKPISSLLSRS